MPYNRPGRGVHVQNTTASAAITHGTPVKEGNFVGVAVKQQALDWGDGVADVRVIADDENYFLITKGVVQVTLGSVVKGDKIYIDGSNALTKTVGSNTPFGIVTEDENERGVPAGMCRIDLDQKPDTPASLLDT